MKRKLLLTAITFLLILLLVPACEAKQMGSLKSLTRPYIAEYECTSATLGDENLLDKFDYILLNLTNKDVLEIIYKPKDGDKKIIETKYSLDAETRELTAEIGILGYNFRQTTKIEKGKFTISKAIGSKQLIMNFKAK